MRPSTVLSPAVLAGLRRPAVLAALAVVFVGTLLASGLVVARAVEGGSTGPTQPSPSASDDASSGEATGTDGGSQGTGDDNTSVAVNTRDGSEVYALRLKVVMTGADTVDATNAAVAAASCSDCQTVAIALEGVLITGDAQTIVPENLALAVNVECDGCQTLAYAYQNVQTTDGKVRITGDGRRRIAALRAELNGLRRTDGDLTALRAQVSRIAADFAEVLRTEVVPIGADPTEDGVSATSASPSTTASTAPTSTGSASPQADTGSQTSDTGPSPSPTASPTPTQSANESATPTAGP